MTGRKRYAEEDDAPQGCLWVAVAAVIMLGFWGGLAWLLFG